MTDKEDKMTWFLTAYMADDPAEDAPFGSYNHLADAINTYIQSTPNRSITDEEHAAFIAKYNETTALDVPTDPYKIRDWFHDRDNRAHQPN